MFNGWSEYDYTSTRTFLFPVTVSTSDRRLQSVFRFYELFVPVVLRYLPVPGSSAFFEAPKKSPRFIFEHDTRELKKY